MKRPVLWIIAAAVVGAAILKDPCIGPVVGLVMGLIIGIPAYYILSGILKLFIKYKGTLPSTIAAYASILLVITLQWLMFHPPAKLIFSTKLASPIPESVTDLKSKSMVVGPDGSHYLWFNISKEDLDKIIHDKTYQLAKEFSFSDNNGCLDIELSSSDSSFHFSLSGPWFSRIKDMTKPEVYTRDNIHNSGGTLEYIIYDPNQSLAFYELSTK
jgi:hypothetical protein